MKAAVKAIFDIAIAGVIGTLALVVYAISSIIAFALFALCVMMIKISLHAQSANEHESATIKEYGRALGRAVFGQED